MKYKPKRSDVKTRELPPKVEATKKGVLVQCPFCSPTHVILPGVQSQCGTTLRVTAVQNIFTAHATRHNDIKCLKCGETGKEMVKYRSGYVCVEECKPDTKLMAEIPPLSKIAQIVFKLPAGVRKIIEKRTGVVKQLQEIDVEGKPTGVIVGHFFWKGKEG